MSLLELYQCSPVGWYGIFSATQLKPDEGTPELPEGKVRVRLETDGSLHDVTEYEIEKVLQFFYPFRCVSVCRRALQRTDATPSLHSATRRSRTCARTWATCGAWTNAESCTLWSVGPKPACRSRTRDPTWSTSGLRYRLTPRWSRPLFPFWRSWWGSFVFHPSFLCLVCQTPKSRRGESIWDAPPALAALVKRVYVSMVGTRRDHSVCALGRSGTGKTTACQAFTLALLKQAGTAGEKMSGEYWHCMDRLMPALCRLVILFPVGSRARAGHVHHPQVFWLRELPAQRCLFPIRHGLLTGLQPRWTGGCRTPTGTQLTQTPSTETDKYRDIHVFFCSSLHAHPCCPDRRWCWTNGRFVSPLQERVTSWSSLRCWQDSAQRWGNLYRWYVTKNIMMLRPARFKMKALVSQSGFGLCTPDLACSSCRVLGDFDLFSVPLKEPY